MTIEQVIARIERAKSIYENAIGSDIVKGRVAMCNDIIDTLRLEAEFHPKQEQQELPEGLEEAAMSYYLSDITNPRHYGEGGKSYPIAINDAFIAGAEYQRKQDQSLIELAEDHAMLAGMNKMKEQMMEKAVEGYVNYYEDSGGILMAEAQVGCPYHNGDKVKIIVIKEEK